MKKILVLLSLLGFTLWACDKDNVVPVFKYPQVKDSVKTPVRLSDSGILAKDIFLFEFKDADSNVYQAIQIGKQIWSKENLKTTRYNDGTPIPRIQEASQWYIGSAGAYCYYNNNGSFSDEYGLLYNYKAAASNKLAPKGWHVATLGDWNALMLAIGNKSFPTIGDVGALVNPRDWPQRPFYSIHDYEVQCTNSTLFTALPNGYRDNSLSKNLPEFDCLGYQASWWATNNQNGEIIYLDQTFGIFNRGDRPRTVGSGIRLVKDAE